MTAPDPEGTTDANATSGDADVADETAPTWAEKLRADLAELPGRLADSLRIGDEPDTDIAPDDATPVGTDDVTDTTTPPAAASSQSGASTTASVEDEVRRQLEKVNREKERDERLDKVERRTEIPPVKQSKLSRMLWGDANKGRD